MIKRTQLLIAAAVATAALTAGGLSGCSTPQSSPEDGLLKVVATTTQVGDFTQQIGGDQISLTTLLTPGSSAHAFDPTPADMIALGEADVLVINGMGLETFLDSAIETSGFTGSIVDASEHLVSEGLIEKTAREDHDGDHDDKHDDDHGHSDEDDHTDGDHGHDDDHGHSHADGNPHIWTSPVLAAEMVHSIAEGLSAVDPDRAEYFEANAEAYELQLEALNDWIAENMAQVPETERLFVSGHNGLEYYLDDYGIAYIGSVLPSFEDNAEPSVAEINQLVTDMKAAGVKAIFVESSINPKMAAIIAEQTGAELISENVIYVDSLGAPGTGAETYIQATIQNTRTLLSAWGYEATPLPAELAE
jgi:zinc/manganese transport system substrate-binding protein/manganese/iron transport system substrate-binding protein